MERRDSPSENIKEKQSIDNDASNSEVGAPMSGQYTAMPSYVSQLKIWSGTYSNVSLFKIFLRPFPFLLSPVASGSRSSKYLETLISYLADMVHISRSWNADGLAQ